MTSIWLTIYAERDVYGICRNFIIKVHRQGRWTGVESKDSFCTVPLLHIFFRFLLMFLVPISFVEVIDSLRYPASNLQDINPIGSGWKLTWSNILFCRPCRCLSLSSDMSHQNFVISFLGNRVHNNVHKENAECPMTAVMCLLAYWDYWQCVHQIALVSFVLF